MRVRLMMVCGLLVSAIGLAVEAGGGGRQDESSFEDARLIIEFNATDEDVGVQLFVDGDPWKLLRVFDPNGTRILEIKGTGSLKTQGLTELFFESSEPSLKDVSLEEFLARFPEGEYEYEGITTEGEEIDGTAVFTHAIPEGPILLTPIEDSVQNPDSTVVSWLPVPDPPGSEITAYQVIVTQILDVLPKREFSVNVPADVNSVTVPSEFMASDAEYEFEVLAIEAGGNQTLSSSGFVTSQ